MRRVFTKKLTEENIKELTTRISNIKKHLDMCDKAEENFNKCGTKSGLENLDKVTFLRKAQTRAALSTIRKFRCLDRNIITDEGFEVLLKAIRYGDVDDLNNALFYYEAGLMVGTVTEEEYNSLVELIKIKTNNEPKTFK